ncbi:MAG: phosphate-starvation-inducible PsiE family protein [Coleofasciculus sp. Co-bin14]|nr:phosphate-starvation-inducible PsiE family protein [Coleofasciculus sp. Co-bin14]
MKRLRKFLSLFRDSCRDKSFLDGVDQVEHFVSKILSIVMAVVILVAVFDLVVFLFKSLFLTPLGSFNKTLFEIFGLFLNILIALEILENITVYLRKNVVLAELVIITTLVAIARKIILIDFEKTSGIDIIGLAIAILSLSISYWIIRRLNNPKSDS